MTFPLTTTLNRIFAANPSCRMGKARALDAAGKAGPDDEPITFAAIVEAVGLNDALWCCKAEPQHGRLWRFYGVWCARQVEPLMADPRSLAALDMAERHANNLATDEELAAAWDAAWAAWDAWDVAWDAARASRDAVGAAAWAAARDAAVAAWEAAQESAWAAAQEAAQAAVWAAARNARAAEMAAARDSAGLLVADARAAALDAQAAAVAAQRRAFIQLVTTGTLPDVARRGVSES